MEACVRLGGYSVAGGRQNWGHNEDVAQVSRWIRRYHPHLQNAAIECPGLPILTDRQAFSNLPSVDGDVPEWLRGLIANQFFSGSNPLVASCGSV